MREDRPTGFETRRPGPGRKPVNWRSCLLLISWLAPLVLWVAALTFLKFNTGLASKAMLLTTGSLAVFTAFIRRHSPAKAWRRGRPG
ncbi:hypothetical protein [Phenylobacterium sp.]|uniref:hypothetical protein n=1 Tax=Phenylobacterium sp. TaxID=1871053 RepID=UPI002BE8456B|nr:hypothetical protein [Phenylobacterium sp.]HVI32315.1 hypothetical protein [Phenylobacterium sp.]